MTHLGPIYDTLLGFSADGAGIVPVADHVDEFTSYLPSITALRVLSA